MDVAAGIELQRRGLTAFVRLLATGSDDSSLLEHDGVIGSVVPGAPDRSVLNSVVYRDAASLRAALEELAGAYEAAGVRAWTVWVPEADREAAALLEAAGHRLDAAPTAMVLDLADLGESRGDGLDWDSNAAVEDVTRINDLAYGFEVGTFGGAMTRMPPGLALRLYQARVDGEPACVMATVDDDADCGIYLVATLKEHRGRGLAGGLLHLALAEARERGLETSSLQSTKFGYPVYARLGYEPICALEMWERREMSG
ncbi:MAG TPA: GNAT family N-acetyltransferase, partial [Solirubrobacterales bacterium]